MRFATSARSDSFRIPRFTSPTEDSVMSLASRRLRSAWLPCLAFMFLVAGLGASAASAEDAKDKAKDAEKDIYAVPDGSPAELLKFIQTFKDQEPKGLTGREQIREHLTKANQAI